MIAVLLSSLRIPAHRLNVTVRPRADPYRCPRWRNNQGANSFQCFLILNALPARIYINESGPGTPSADPFSLWNEIPESRLFSGLNFCRDFLRNDDECGSHSSSGWTHSSAETART